MSTHAHHQHQPIAPASPVLGWIVVVAVDALVFWLSVPNFVVDYELPIWLAFALATLQGLTLPLAVRFPRIALGIQLTLVVVVAFLLRGNVDDYWPVTVPTLLAVTATLVVVALRHRWLYAVAGWWLLFLALVVAVVLFAGPQRSTEDWGIDALLTVTVTLAAVAVAVGIGQRRQARTLLATAERDRELEQARRETVEERARLARELHDVVAHSMSMVHIQAESARYRVADVDEAKDEFAGIARSARTALREMRQLLGALRPDAADPSYLPQPALADIPALVDTVRRVGHRVDLVDEVPPAWCGPLVELTAYRVVQEALSNVARHAPAADVDIELAATPTGIIVRVTNGPSPATPAGRPAPPDPGGQGLPGMRERVRLLDGELVHRRLDDGGFLVEARLPVATIAVDEAAAP